MKLKVGGQVVSEVPSSAVRKPEIRRDVVDDFVISRTVDLIKQYKHKPGARDRFRQALGE